MSEQVHPTLATRLRNAYAAGPVPPLRDGLEPTDAAGAYAVQRLNTEHWVGQGRRITGRKIGLTAKAVQAQLGVDQPDYGVLFDDMAIDDGGTLFASKVLQPKAEAEIALVMEKDLDDPEAGIHDVIRAAAYALPAIEIVDSRIADWKITYADTVADNASSAFYVLGREPRLLAGLDLLTCGMVLEIDGTIVSLGAGAACLGHPLVAAAWLARTLSRLGDGLRAGDVVLTGALGPMVALKPGNIVRTAIGGLGACGFVYRDDRV
ncbi:2-keto-4-pentenoate hydratase [Zavarzinia sp.]|uniref:2-keto-4-pentenoate hydratase n=1 Tax=Zavarzinia sp. TaxID=2027920 RepID=UPI0035615BEB